MKIAIEVNNRYKKGDWFCMILPSLGVGYYRKFLHITLYVLVWEFSVELD